LAYVVRPMRLDDVDEVGRVERECFTTPWPASAYRREIRDNRLSRYIVITSDEAADEAASPGAAAEGASESGCDCDSTDRTSALRRALEQLLRPLGIGGSAEPAPRGERIVGFAGMWLMIDEAHITTICVAKSHRGRGLGEVLMSRLMDLAAEIGADRVTLEVRVSNEPAKSLYRKYGFAEEGIRKRYYSDDNEDAAIMWSQSLGDQAYRSRLDALRAESLARAGALTIVPTETRSQM
jgi:[ribosomal protein S18]-alanine N-acetyltransferase